MRELYMKTGQGFLLVFSITSLSSLAELSELREQIIRIKDDENVPIVIVGNKSDLEGDRAVSRAKAFAVSQSWGNAPYYETSARRRGILFFCFLFLVLSLFFVVLTGYVKRDRSFIPYLHLYLCPYLFVLSSLQKRASLC
jgi:Ras-related protein Rap-1B